MMNRVLSERDRYLLAGLAGGLLVVVLGVALWNYLAALDRLQLRADKAANLITEIQTVQAEVATLRGQLRGQPASTQRAVSATVLMENTASSLGLRDRLVSLRPQVVSPDSPIQESLEVVAEKLSLTELVRWLFLLETSPGANQVTQLRMRKRFDDKELFDVTLAVVRFGGVN